MILDVLGHLNVMITEIFEVLCKVNLPILSDLFEVFQRILSSVTQNSLPVDLYDQ